MKLVRVAALLLVAGCSPAVPTPSADVPTVAPAGQSLEAPTDGGLAEHVVDANTGRLGRIGVGMSLAEAKMSGYPVRALLLQEEGDDYDALDITIGNAGVVRCVFDADGSMHRMEIRSAAFRNQDGVGVDTTLAELARVYPHGDTMIGSAEGHFFVFSNASRIYFDLDRTGLADRCFDPLAAPCDPDPDTRVVGMRIYADVD